MTSSLPPKAPHTEESSSLNRQIPCPLTAKYVVVQLDVAKLVKDEAEETKKKAQSMKTKYYVGLVTQVRPQC
jgi:hypothetical protein